MCHAETHRANWWRPKVKEMSWQQPEKEHRHTGNKLHLASHRKKWWPGSNRRGGFQPRILHPEEISLQNEYVIDIFRYTKTEGVHFQETCSKGKANRESLCWKEMTPNGNSDLQNGKASIRDGKYASAKTNLFSLRFLKR